MRVTMITPSLDHPIDYYRAILPLTKAEKAGKIELTHKPAWDVILDARTNPAQLEKDLTADIVMVRGSLTRQKLKSFRDLHKAVGSTSKIVYDYDDNPFAVSPFNQSYGASGTEEVFLNMPDGTKAGLWVDGKNIDIEENRAKSEYLKLALAEADLITTTTEYLANVLRVYNPNVKVLPNCIDLKRFTKLELPKREVRVLWTGSASHYEDVLEMQRTFLKMLSAYPEVKLVICGYVPPGMKINFPSDRVEYHEWDHVMSYPYRLAALNADIALIPLRDTEFNRCKSPLKFLEMSALSIPSVVSHVGPYREIVELSGNDDIGMFVEGFNPDDWLTAIAFLIEKPALRNLMGQKARTFIEEHFDINKRCGEWPKAYASSVLLEVA